MSTHTTANTVKMPLIQIGSMGLLVCIVIAFSAGMISSNRGDLFSDGLWTLLATVPGVLIPTAILLFMPPKEPGAWSVPVLAGTMIRAMVVLTIGLAIYMLIAPAKVLFFMALLCALMITLIIDVSSVLILIQKHSSGMMPAADAEVVS